MGIHLKGEWGELISPCRNEEERPSNSLEKKTKGEKKELIPGQRVSSRGWSHSKKNVWGRVGGKNEEKSIKYNSA